MEILHAKCVLLLLVFIYFFFFHFEYEVRAHSIIFVVLNNTLLQFERKLPSWVCACVMRACDQAIFKRNQIKSCYIQDNVKSIKTVKKRYIENYKNAITDKETLSSESMKKREKKIENDPLFKAPTC